MANLKVLISFSPDETSFQLVEKAIALAESSNVDVCLFICDYMSSLSSNLLLHKDNLEKAIDHIKKEHTKKLQKVVEQYSQSSVNFSIKVEWHKPYYEAILKAAEDFKADLVFKQSHKHSLWQQILFTPSDYQLLKSCSQPLLLTKGHVWGENQTIIAAVDPSHQLSQESHLDDTIVQQAKELSQSLKMPLKVCHVFDPTGWEVVLNSSASAGVMGQFVVLETPEEHRLLLDKVREQHWQQLKKLQSRHQLQDDQIALLEGFPENTLEQAVKDNNAAIMIMGTTYRSGLLGSTAEKMLEHISCDVVAVKPGDFAALNTH